MLSRTGAWPQQSLSSNETRLGAEIHVRECDKKEKVMSSRFSDLDEILST
jgi:hypothetical protein